MNNFRIYRYVNPEHHPASLDMHPGHIIFPDQLNINLPKKPDIVLGERRRSTYYDRFEDEQYEEPVVKIDYAFKRDAKGLVYEKLRTISWMLENDNWSSEVQTDVIPVVSEAEKLSEIKRRRYNIITELKGLAKRYTTEDLPLETKILEIFEEKQLLINSYIDAGSSKFRDAILSNGAEWLDEVISATGNKSRDVIAQYVSIGLAER